MASSPKPSTGSHEPPFTSADFPGCDPVRIAREDIRDYEGRYEFWDADSEIAWVAREGPCSDHDGPGQRLAQLVEIIALARGSPIEAWGSTPLTLREGNAEGSVEAGALAAQQSLLRLQAERKFGVEAAAQFGAILEAVADADRLAEVAHLIVDCDTDEELLARLS